MGDPVDELTKFLQLGSRLDLKDYALTQVLGLTGSPEGLKLVTTKPTVLTCLLSLLNDNAPTVKKESALTLVNVSADENGARALIELNPTEHNTNKLQKPPLDIIKSVLNFVLDKKSPIADPCCMILANLTRNPAHAEQVIDELERTDRFEALLNAFTKIEYNERASKLHYLGPIFSNLSQSPTVRKHILNRKNNVLQRLIAFTEYQDSIIRRGGVIGTLKNCCFEEEHHEWLLSEDVDILPRLLLPLAGNTEYDDEDNDKLPPELQYLPEDKKREDDPDIRCMLLEAITQLCAVKKNREQIRDKNAYIILRELHKWETDRKALLACENLVDILIRTEEEIAQENLKDLDIPDDLTERFHKMDADFLTDK